MEEMTHVNERFELRVVRHLVVNSIGSNWVVRDVLHVSLAEVEDRIVHSSCDATDLWMFLALDLVESIEHLAMVHVELRKVVEDVANELSETVPRNNGRIHLAQWLNIHL